jgi:hypothetical protein
LRRPGLLGIERPFVAVALDADGKRVAGLDVRWRSSDPAVATIDSITGRARALANGVTQITGSVGRVSGTATLVVAQRAAIVEIEPIDTIRALGLVVPLTATARDAMGNVTPDTLFDWVSSDTLVLYVSPYGRIVSLSQGSALVTASAGGARGNLLALVRQQPVAMELAITLRVLASQSAQITVRGRDVNEYPLSQMWGAWTSSDGTVATVDSVGVVLGHAPGSAEIVLDYPPSRTRRGSSLRKRPPTSPWGRSRRIRAPSRPAAWSTAGARPSREAATSGCRASGPLRCLRRRSSGRSRRALSTRAPWMAMAPRTAGATTTPDNWVTAAR